MGFYCKSLRMGEARNITPLSMAPVPLTDSRNTRVLFPSYEHFSTQVTVSGEQEEGELRRSFTQCTVFSNPDTATILRRSET